ncbi:MAG TPA: GGDEF domain-containing protein [Candidatus Elarobacter sp.]|nr:GGDEF domain-containing protein [Candidatus Elarobacter sp.]
MRAAAAAVDGVLLYEEQDGALRCVTAAGDRFSYFAGSCIALDNASSLPARAFSARHRITVGVEECRGAAIRPMHPGDAAAVAVPLAVDAELACVLVAASQCAIDCETADRIVALAEHAAPAYLIALDRERDRRRAEYDGLTGLLTPRALRQRLAQLVDCARFRPSARIALLFADTDHFKRWNDAYGHAAGDALLRELATVLRSSASSERDLVARNGGDEFCIVFTETGKAAAIERAEALRRHIAALDLRALRPPTAAVEIQISASIGVAAFPPDAASANALLEVADAAMYHSKRTGRDGVAYRDAAGVFTRFSATDP